MAPTGDGKVDRRALGLNANNAAAHAAFRQLALLRGSRGRSHLGNCFFGNWTRRRSPDPMSPRSSLPFPPDFRRCRSRIPPQPRAVRPDDASALVVLGFRANHQQCRPPRPRGCWKSLSLFPLGRPAVTGVLIRAYAHAGRRADALRLLASLKRRKAAGIWAGAFVNAYLGLDDRDAFYWLEQAFAKNPPSCSSSKSTPLRPIRSDPRFVDRSIALAWASSAAIPDRCPRPPRQRPCLGHETSLCNTAPRSECPGPPPPGSSHTHHAFPNRCPRFAPVNAVHRSNVAPDHAAGVQVHQNCFPGVD